MRFQLRFVTVIVLFLIVSGYVGMNAVRYQSMERKQINVFILDGEYVQSGKEPKYSNVIVVREQYGWPLTFFTRSPQNIPLLPEKAVRCEPAPENQVIEWKYTCLVGNLIIGLIVVTIVTVVFEVFFYGNKM